MRQKSSNHHGDYEGYMRNAGLMTPFNHPLPRSTQTFILLTTSGAPVVHRSLSLLRWPASLSWAEIYHLPGKRWKHNHPDVGCPDEDRVPLTPSICPGRQEKHQPSCCSVNEAAGTGVAGRPRGREIVTDVANWDQQGPRVSVRTPHNKWTS